MANEAAAKLLQNTGNTTGKLPEATNDASNVPSTSTDVEK